MDVGPDKESGIMNHKAPLGFVQLLSSGGSDAFLSDVAAFVSPRPKSRLGDAETDR